MRSSGLGSVADKVPTAFFALETIVQIIDHVEILKVSAASTFSLRSPPYAPRQTLVTKGRPHPWIAGSVLLACNMKRACNHHRG